MLGIMVALQSCAQQNELQKNNIGTDAEKKAKEEQVVIENRMISPAASKAGKERDRAKDDVKTTTGGANTATTTTITTGNASNAPVNAEVNQQVFDLQEDGLQFSIEILPDQAPGADIRTILSDDPYMGITPEKEDDDAKLPPMRYVRVKISIQNKQSQAMWYLLPSQGEVALQDNGRFESATPDAAFAGREYMGVVNGDSSQLGKLVECHFRGNYQHGFKAFYLPPQSSITLRNYPLEVWGDLKEIELWGVKSLLVNGAKPLQEWLPFSVLSDNGNLRVTCPTEGSCICKDVDYKSNAELVTFMQAQEFKKYHLVLP